MINIQAMFSDISPTYDRLNFLLSFGLDRVWRKGLVKALPFRGGAVLDCCTGTGDLAILLSRAGYEVIGLDFCEPMLTLAARKAPKGVSLKFIEGNALTLPFSDRSFRAVTSAFSLRNIPDLKRAFLETHRVLAADGVALFLDLTRPTSWFSPLHNFYVMYVLPRVGKMISGHEEAYAYLCRSILHFKTPQEITTLLEACSFRNVHHRSLTGGICTLWTAQK